MVKKYVSLCLLVLSIITITNFLVTDGVVELKLKSEKLCQQCSKCDSKNCPPSEAFPHMTTYDDTLIAGALQSDFVDFNDKGVYSVPNILGGQSKEYNSYYGWKSTSGSASGYHR